jgi:H+/Na+-translocating ferredoxin:NAD+ oxidoreductase subunit G
MNEMIKMVVVLTVLSVISGGALAFLQKNTTLLIENNKLQFIKGPAVKEILGGTSNNPIVDRFKIKQGDKEDSFFVGKYDGSPKAVVLESSGKGFGGDVGIVWTTIRSWGYASPAKLKLRASVHGPKPTSPSYPNSRGKH